MRDFRKWHKKWNLPGDLPFMRSHKIPGAHFCGLGQGVRRFPFPRIFKFWRMRYPFLNYEDKEEEYLLKIEVPGIEKDKINAKASSDTLTVEIDGNPYFYPLPPNVDPEKVYATLKLGILTIHLPKKEPDHKVGIE